MYSNDDTSAIAEPEDLIYELTTEEYVPDGCERIYLMRYLQNLIASTRESLPAGTRISFRRSEDFTFAESGDRSTERWDCMIVSGVPDGRSFDAIANGCGSPLEAFDGAVSDLRKQLLTHAVLTGAKAGEMAGAA